MKLLFIAEKQHYRDWPGKTYADLLIYYKNNSKHQVALIYTDHILDTINPNHKPDIIVFFDTDTLRFANNYSFLFNLNIPIFASSLDLFWFRNCINCHWIQKCAGLLHFGHASNLLSSYKEHFPNKIIKSFKGRFINSCRFKNYNLNKKYDILIFGSRSTATTLREEHNADKEYKNKWENYNKKKISNKLLFYPLRTKLEKLFIKNKNKYNLHILPNKCIFNAPVANEDLSKLINQSWLTMATCARADISFAKYFEISASYSGILGNIPSDYNDLFKNNIVEVTEFMTDEEILSIIDKALEDKQKLQEMINRLGNRIHKEYNLEAGTKDMDEIFDELIVNK